jgi:hypothetical protein
MIVYYILENVIVAVKPVPHQEQTLVYPVLMLDLLLKTAVHVRVPSLENVVSNTLVSVQTHVTPVLVLQHQIVSNVVKMPTGATEHAYVMLIGLETPHAQLIQVYAQLYVMVVSMPTLVTIAS